MGRVIKDGCPWFMQLQVSIFTPGVVHGNIVMSIFEYVSIKILLTQNIMNLTAFVNTWHA